MEKLFLLCNTVTEAQAEQHPGTNAKSNLQRKQKTAARNRPRHGANHTTLNRQRRSAHNTQPDSANNSQNRQVYGDSLTSTLSSGIRPPGTCANITSQGEKGRWDIKPTVNSQLTGSSGEAINIYRDRTSRQTQAGIGHGACAHRDGHVQNRSGSREQHWGRHRTELQAAQPRVDRRPSRKVKACQHRRRRRQPGARRRRHTK